jgi:uncharacterized membrane protein
MLDEILLLAQQAPRLSTSYDWLMFASRLLHILSAIILVGGLFYLWAVVTPTAAPPGTAPVDQYFGGRRAAWAKWIGIASLFLLVTGLWNFIQMVKTNEIATSYHMLGGLKILAGLGLMFLAALLAGRTAAADSLRMKWRMWLSVCLILGIVTVALGTVMRTYPRTEKLDAADGPQLIAPSP